MHASRNLRREVPGNDVIVEFDERKIDSIFASLNQCILPGAAVGIAIDGKPVYRKGFGLASMDLPVNLSPTMRMRIGSTSKQFTAFAYMMLCEEGKAGADDPIGKYLPELHPITHKVTMRQLMGNISGLREATDLVVQFSGFDSRRIVTTDDLLSLYHDVDDVNAPPGVTYDYNNGGWVILTAVIERITGQTLERVLSERVFEPIGMSDTMLRRWDSTFVPNSASSHTANVSIVDVLRSGSIHAASRYERTETHGGIDFAGAGSVVSTIDDMLRWMAHMDAPTVGSPATWAAMRTPQKLRNGTSTGYGLGLQTSPYRGIGTLQHGGGGQGSNVQMIKVPSASLDVIVMVNRSDVSSFGFADKIIDACLPGLDIETNAARAAGPIATGIFRSARTGRVIQLFEVNGQQYASVNCHEMPMEPDSNGVLRTVGAFASLNYEVVRRGDPVKPHSIRFSEFGNFDELSLAMPSGSGDTRPIEGRFRSETTGTVATITRSGGGHQMDVVGRFGSASHKLDYVTDGVWRTKPTNIAVLPAWGMIALDPDGSGFAFSNAANNNLRFRRIN